MLFNNSAAAIPPQRRLCQCARAACLQNSLPPISARVFLQNAFRKFLRASSGKGLTTRSSRMRTAVVCLLYCNAASQKISRVKVEFRT
jgi:hypothetical protein